MAIRYHCRETMWNGVASLSVSLSIVYTELLASSQVVANRVYDELAGLSAAQTLVGAGGCFQAVRLKGCITFTSEYSQNFIIV